ncbi:alpha/beta hydrolase [Parasphingopyxis algicola]|uniref:alpha/beta fold hydrolase n=1 Tax=Parasphingopyxis algicola TaxID=2026624 RepID=UPI00159F8922|nr:alpha/beta hydrolase [Parasphingopyxis algicola]QLC26358.1 alpha/beta hydrolase [Parasphingopyxis algicola]
MLAARANWLAKEDAKVIARHSHGNSRFINVDGVHIHYLDEGEGPGLLLLHGSYLDLGVWDGWAANLIRDHRVVRLDRACYGLTGRDPFETFGYEREADLVAAFAEKIGLGNYIVVGASSGGTTAGRIAAHHPERVSGVVLINFPYVRKSVRPTPSYALSIWIRDRLLVNHQPGWHMGWTIRANLTDKARATRALIRRLTDQANRPGMLGDRLRLEKGCAAYSPEKRLDDFVAIRAPTLLIWGRDNHLLTVESGRQAYDAIGADLKWMKIITGGSHMIPLEKSDESLQIVREFLDQVVHASITKRI